MSGDHLVGQVSGLFGDLAAYMDNAAGAVGNDGQAGALVDGGEESGCRQLFFLSHRDVVGDEEEVVLPPAFERCDDAVRP